MAEVDPLKPSFPSRPLRPVDKDERRDERPKARVPQPAKRPSDPDDDRPKLDEYA